MAVLLDTCAFLWWLEDAEELTEAARRAIVDDPDCHVSVASFWEISIKISHGKLWLPHTVEKYIPEQMAANGFTQLPIGFRDVCRVSKMPFHHKDPFDRLLVAQCEESKLSIISSDDVFDRYGIQRIW